MTDHNHNYHNYRNYHIHGFRPGRGMRLETKIPIISLITRGRGAAGLAPEHQPEHGGVCQSSRSRANGKLTV
jgi:hypothetical protein